MTTSTASPEDAVLVAEHISKSYGGVHALRDVTFTARRGDVNVVVGENGAGKSTLMKILSGAESPTAGRILLDGEEVDLSTPRAAKAHGIGIIHQELNLFPNLSISENIFAGVERRDSLRLVDRARQRSEAAEVLARLDQERLDPDTLVGTLAIGQQQLVEIGRVLTEQVRILIMDEPTSALSNSEVEVLFRVMAELRREGVTVIYISHKLDEFRRIGDHVTVLRDGRLVAEAAMRDTDTAWIVEQMVGRRQDSLFRREESTPGEVLLEVTNLSSADVTGPVIDEVSFSVRAGEIVGIYGLMGAGRTELMECLMGARPTSTGEVRIRGELCGDAGVWSRLQNGLALVPEDRQRDGLVQTLSVKENLLLSSLGALAGRFLLRRGDQQVAASHQASRLGIKAPSLDASISSLSGGNQQKVVLARAMLTKPTVLLLDEPTRGVDVGAKSEIARIMTELARSGVGVLFISSELGEVLGLADRILVMARGRITADLPGSQATEQRLVAASASDTVMKAAS